MELEAVLRALGWIALRKDSQPTHRLGEPAGATETGKGKSGMGSPDWQWHVTVFDIHL